MGRSWQVVIYNCWFLVCLNQLIDLVLALVFCDIVIVAPIFAASPLNFTPECAKPASCKHSYDGFRCFDESWREFGLRNQVVHLYK